MNEDHMAGQNIGRASDLRTEGGMTAFHLRKRGQTLNGDDEELKQVPIVPLGERLQQGATYVDLTDPRPQEFTARGDMHARPGNAYVPKDQVPYEIWNRLIGEEKRR